ncbi:MAG TPA: cytochrome c oxidase assembly protein [Patescibacteria group bacterium]|nr:cytochrome c oxidase assembly protein [Patescibacteria group bacterium]
MNAELQKKNRKVLKITLGVVAAMIVLSFASVPIYRLTCQLTGWGGTTQTEEVAAAKKERAALARNITIRFKVDTAADLPWDFRAEQGPVKLAIGADGFASFQALNRAGDAVTGTAIHNVTPLRAGKYFYLTQCFCFGEQVLNPGQKVSMPVVFYIDPKIADDPDLKNLDTITLNYSFFRKDSPAHEKAMIKYVNDKG